MILIIIIFLNFRLKYFFLSCVFSSTAKCASLLPTSQTQINPTTQQAIECSSLQLSMGTIGSVANGWQCSNKWSNPALFKIEFAAFEFVKAETFSFVFAKLFVKLQIKF